VSIVRIMNLPLERVSEENHELDWVDDAPGGSPLCPRLGEEGHSRNRTIRVNEQRITYNHEKSGQ
jgi:hypothetical protein